MTENNSKNFKVELQINLITGLNYTNDLFLIDSTEIINEKKNIFR